MPKFPKNFGRRKTTIPPEEDPEKNAPVIEHSFRVFDRSDRVGKSVDSDVRSSKTSLPAAGRSFLPQIEDDNLFENFGSNHSGASNTLTSVTDNSSRLSAISTVPSSTDHTHGQDWTSPHDKPFTDIPTPPAPRKSSTFLKNAGYAMSWGKQKVSSSKDLTSFPMDRGSEEGAGGTVRGGRTSSYAVTTVPPKCYEKEPQINLGADYTRTLPAYERRQFSTRGNGKHEKTQEPFLTQKHSRPYPTPLNLESSKKIENFTDTWNGQRSSQGLILGASPPPVASRQSPRSPLVPHHAPPRVTSPATSSTSEQRCMKLQENEMRSRSLSRERKSDHEGTVPPFDEDARLLQDSINASRRLEEQSANTQGDWSTPNSTQHLHPTRSTTETPDQSRVNVFREGKKSNENMFDSTILHQAILAEKYQEQSASSTKSSTPYTKIMTPAQFERYKQDQERLRDLGGHKTSGEGEDEDEGYDEEEEDKDELEKAKMAARQRRKQEAHMAVYRQQMMKVIGEAPPITSIRPNVYTSQSSPNLTNIGQPEDTEEEDEEIPLAVLQAHGFPNKNRPPSARNNMSNPNIKITTASTTGGAVDPRLPVFARNLPQDPYYGSGIVRPIQRESMAFSGGSPGNIGGLKGLPPGGLVGVIATEERSRALRRGSPNSQGEFSAQVPSNPSGPTKSGNESAGGLINKIGPGLSTNPVPPPMMLTPGDQAQIQMTQQMQQFMQMQMHFMQMMAHGTSQPPSYPHKLPEIPRPASAQMHQRSMTMMNQNSTPWLNRASTYVPSMYAGNNYAPSIAPSERSNVGLPGRYRPVSQAQPNALNRSRSSSACGVLQTWDDKSNIRTSTYVKAVNSKIDHISDEDEDEAWEKLTKKRKEKKSVWRTKKEKDSNGLKEMLSYLN